MELEEVLEKKEGLVVLDFYAGWCGPCRVLGPIFEEFAKNNEDKAIYKVNADDYGDIMREYGVRGLPTVLYLKDGEVIERLTGVQTLITLQEKLDKYA